MGETIDVKKVNGTWIVTGWDWDKSTSDDIEVTYVNIPNENGNYKWFNVRLDYTGRYIESSESYDSKEDALRYKLESDTDTIKMNVYGK